MTRIMESLRAQIASPIESAYQRNKVPECDGMPTFSEVFFNQFREEGLISAYNGFIHHIREVCAVEDTSPLGVHALGLKVLAACTLASTGLTQYVKGIKSEEELSILQKVAAAIYFGGLLPLLAGYSGGDDSDSTYSVDRGGVSPTGGHMTKEQAERAERELNRKGFW